MSSPLKRGGTDNLDYGAINSQRTIGQGGIMTLVPTEGYCMVFDTMADSKWYILEEGNDKLIVRRNPECNEEEFYSKNCQKNIRMHKNSETDEYELDILKNFKAANIRYTIERSTDKQRKWIYVIISCKAAIAEEWADRHNIDIGLDPVEAVKIGRKRTDFTLAHRTYVPILDDKKDEYKAREQAEPTLIQKFCPSLVKSNQKTRYFREETVDAKREFKMVPFGCWNSIHIPYESTVDRKVYSKFLQAGNDRNGSVISHRLYLRILYDMLTDDVKLGGANFIVNKYLANSLHPLQYFFALHQEPAPEFTRSHLLEYRTPYGDRKFVDRVREYYGENIGFYFGFLVHYTFWLYPFAAVGTIWFIIQLSVGRIAVQGSTIIVLIAIMWSTLMIENWYRREWKLRFKWGMMRYSETEIPRPTFRGKLEVSHANGEIIESYGNWYTHCLKVTFSLSTMLFCIAIVLVVVVSLWILKGLNKNDQVLSIGIGMLNSIQIFIMNKLYTLLAYKLTEWEGHRLQQDYYNNLVIKRIIFIIVNSFNSLFYIAFFQGEDVYPDDIVRLEAVRTQLVTLFIMAIFIQNTMEVFIPWSTAKVRECLHERAENQLIEEDNGAGFQSDALLSDDETAHNAQGLFMNVNPVDIGDDNIEINHDDDVVIRQQSTIHSKVNDIIMEDIRNQTTLGKSPDVLDNTAEVIVLHGYIMLFVTIFPLMPLLAVINNIAEVRIDFYNLVSSQRPVPESAAGLGVWKTVMATFNIIAIFSNLALITFRTTLISDLSFMDDGDIMNGQQKLILFYFVTSLFLLFITGSIRFMIDDKPVSIKDAIARQELCEKHLLMARVKILARKQSIKEIDQHRNVLKEEEPQQLDDVELNINE